MIPQLSATRRRARLSRGSRSRFPRRRVLVRLFSPSFFMMLSCSCTCRGQPDTLVSTPPAPVPHRPLLWGCYSRWYRNSCLCAFHPWTNPRPHIGAFGGLLAFGISFMAGTRGLLGWSWIFVRPDFSCIDPLTSKRLPEVFRCWKASPQSVSELPHCLVCTQRDSLPSNTD